MYLDLAVFCQSFEHIARAETHYAKALSLFPADYEIPGYLHRVQTLDRLLFNYHRFCSIFNSRQVNILAKVVPVAKRGAQIRFIVTKLNQYTAVIPADPEDVCRVNAIYLSEDEVLAFLTAHGKPVAAEKSRTNVLAQQDGPSTSQNRSLNSSASWRKNSQKSSMRQKSFRVAMKDAPVAEREGAKPPVAQRFVVFQLYQDEFRGLSVRPAKFSVTSEKRSKLSVTREHAEMLLKALVFIAPTSHPTRETLNDGETVGSGGTQVADASSPANSLRHVVVLPFLVKLRQQRIASVLTSSAAINVQRVFRGFQFRSQLRRERMVQDIQQRQVDQMLAHLQANFVLREHRRNSAIAIQRMYKGFTLRNHIRRWHVDATHIQRVFRGFRGRKRALAFRDGNCTFYMAEKVFQRGLEISGRRIMLAIEKVRLFLRGCLFASVLLVFGLMLLTSQLRN